MTDFDISQPFGGAGDGLLPTAALSQFAAGLRYEDVPGEVVLHAKLSLLDTLGVAYAGVAQGMDGDLLPAYAKACGGSGPSALWWSADRVPAGYAALANASRARALDYDDIVPFPQIHVATAVVPAVLALAQAIGHTDGADILTSIVVGCEVQSRLAAAVAPTFGTGVPIIQASQVFGYFSAAAACGRLLYLSSESMISAFGLALMQAAGTQEMVVHAGTSMGKSLYAGLSNQGGVQSALMAQQGVYAVGAALEGRAGLFAAHFGNAFDLAALTADLGTRFQSLHRCFKAMPGTLVSHAFAEAAISLMRRHAVADLQDITRIELDVGPWGRTMCEPSALRRAPTSGSAAMNSIPFVVAKAVVNGCVSLEDFTSAGLREPRALSVAHLIQHNFDAFLARPGSLEPGIVTLFLADGRIVRETVEVPLGHPARPFSASDAERKFRTNAGCGATPLAATRVEALVDTIMTLEERSDPDALFSLIGA